MATLLERYHSGQHEAVWADLNALGDAVRSPAYLPDAKAVAEETMKRVLHNAHLLDQRLRSLGYRFHAEEDATSRMGDLRQQMQSLQSFAGILSQKPVADPHSPQFNPALGQLIERAQTMGDRVEKASGLLGMIFGSKAPPAPKPASAITPPDRDIARDIRKYEESIGGPLPLSLDAWARIVGAVSFIGEHPTLAFRIGHQPPAMLVNPISMPSADELLDDMRQSGLRVATQLPEPTPDPPFADPLDIQVTFDEWDEDDSDIHRMILGGDAEMKAGIEGDCDPYCIEVPSANADSKFTGQPNTNFIDYLRIAFHWGGFPGWQNYTQRPEKELAFLREGLLPF